MMKNTMLRQVDKFQNRGSIDVMNKHRKLIRNDEEYDAVCDELMTGFGYHPYPFILLHGDPPGIGHTYSWDIVCLSEFTDPK